MDYIRISAKTVADAIIEASIQLETSSDNIEYEVIEAGSSGFFGIGSKQAVISVRKKREYSSDLDLMEDTIIKDKIIKEKKSEVKKSEVKKEALNTVKEAEKPIDKVETIKTAVEFIEKTCKAMNVNVVVKAEFDEENNLNADMSGNDMGILIGKRGQTLDALQYLTSLVVNKGKASYIRVKLDTENYRLRRKETLESLAKNIASKVKRTRRPVFLEPMNPYERRVIHSTLQNDPYVSTHSEGEEPYRKVVVTLKK